MAKQKKVVEFSEPKPKEVLFKISKEMSTAMSTSIDQLLQQINQLATLKEKEAYLFDNISAVFKEVEDSRKEDPSDEESRFDRSIVLSSLLHDNLRNGYYYQLSEILNTDGDFPVEDLIAAAVTRILKRREKVTPETQFMIGAIENELLSALSLES